MELRKSSLAWWGPPKKFDPNFEDRRVSWLELFFDLVYVIAISRITHRLAHHMSFADFADYVSMFTLIFWGWLNGSLYHDLHGTEGLRTRLMTLWQMMIIAALAITIDQSSAEFRTNTTIIFMIMQVFVTYMWWSVGLYDKDHRKYNKPYTVCFMISLCLMGLSLVVDDSWHKFIVPFIVLFDFTPPFIANRQLRRSSLSLDLSASMAERLGLFTIIVFGELVLGVVNGISVTHVPDFSAWINFPLALTIVFMLWWIFFTLLSNREAKKGFVKATVLEMLFIPTLISLGVIGACFTSLFETNHGPEFIQRVFGVAVGIFFLGISLMMGLLQYPANVINIVPKVRVSLFIVAGVFLAGSLLIPHLETLYYLVMVIFVITLKILYLNSLYYGQNLGDRSEE